MEQELVSEAKNKKQEQSGCSKHLWGRSTKGRLTPAANQIIRPKIIEWKIIKLYNGGKNNLMRELVTAETRGGKTVHLLTTE